MKIITNQIVDGLSAIVRVDEQYKQCHIERSLIAEPLKATPYRKKDVFKVVRKHFKLDEDPSQWDVILPRYPLNGSLRLWRRESVERLPSSSTVFPKVRKYVKGLLVRKYVKERSRYEEQPLRLDFQLNLIRVVSFIATQLHQHLGCVFYSEKEIAALTRTSQETISKCFKALKERELLEVVTCRNNRKNGKVLGSYVRVTDEFKDLFLSGIEWPESEKPYPYTESDFLKHLHEIERIKRELLNLIKNKSYPEEVINHAYYLLAC